MTHKKGIGIAKLNVLYFLHTQIIHLNANISTQQKKRVAQIHISTHPHPTPIS